MALNHSPKIITDGLVFCYDAANPKSYPGTGTSVTNIIGMTEGEVISATYSSNENGYFAFATDDLIRFPEDSRLNSQTITVEVWAKTNALSQNGFWFEKGSVNSQYSLFQEGVSIRWRANFGAGLVNMVSPTTATYINTTDWFHIVATFVTGDQRVYINGIQAGTGTSAGTIATNANGMSIGAYGGYSGSRGYYYNGNISSVRVYDRVLTISEVKQNFEALRGRYGI
jgi:hypothetical protein